MRFTEAYGGWQAKRLTQEEAARLLGVCERTFRRYIDRYGDLSHHSRVVSAKDVADGLKNFTIRFMPDGTLAR